MFFVSHPLRHINIYSSLAIKPSTYFNYIYINYIFFLFHFHLISEMAANNPDRKVDPSQYHDLVHHWCSKKGQVCIYNAIDILPNVNIMQHFLIYFSFSLL